VQFDSGRNRYRLHDLVRIFARTLIADEDLAVVQHLHSQHYGGVFLYLKSLYYQGQNKMLRALAAFDTEWLNIQVGQAWAIANGARDADTAKLCAQYAINEILSLRLHPHEQIRWIESALAFAEIANDPKQKESLLGNLGNAYADLGESLIAIRVTKEALEISIELGAKGSECIWLNNIGNRYMERGEVREAIRYYEPAWWFVNCCVKVQAGNDSFLKCIDRMTA
jgi:tetratricopeptide (TPR) repeat protein